MMATPYHVNMNSDQALHLVKVGASLLFLNVPASTSFGIDLQVILFHLHCSLQHSVTCCNFGFRRASRIVETRLKREREKDDADVAIGVNYGVASSLS
jgi:hypothetical protein